MRVGRYEIREELGRGGMGTVHAGYDPRLRRDVAIKLLHPGSNAQRRLLREAQAVARIHHRHVVTVYDVGEFEDADGEMGVFMVMEHIRGQTLTQWLQSGRALSEVLDVFAQAGEGLLAAHGRGLVHRDFKPGNFLIDADGGARVLDFGLAVPGSSDAASTHDATEGASAPAAEPLTEAGVVVGTPHYMSPEQHRGGTLDARTDQYSFCLSLAEALAGTAILSEVSPRALAAEKARGFAGRLPPDLPPGVRKALERGLSPEPEDRWPGMRVLIQALRPTHRSGLGSKLAGAALAVTACGGLLFATLGGEAPPVDCTRYEDFAEPAWNDDIRAEIESVFVDENGGLTVGGSWVINQLDDAAHELSASRVASCTAVDRGRVNDPRPSSSVRCLEVLRQELAETAGRVGSGAERTMSNAPALVALLRRPADCAGPEASRMTDDEELRSALFELRLLVAEGRLSEALSQYDPLESAARGNALEVEVWLLGALIHGRMGRIPESLIASAAALTGAETSGRDRLAIEALILRAQALNHGELEQLDEARRAVELADAKAARLSTEADFLLPQVRFVDAALCERELFEQMRGATPQSCWEAAERAVKAASGASPIELAGALNLAANAAMNAGEPQRATVLVDRAIELRTSVSGPRHASLANPYRVRARADLRLGRDEDALEHLNRAFELVEADEASGAAAEILLERGELRAVRQEFAAARADFLRSAEHAPPQLRYHALTRVAGTSSDLGNIEQALLESAQALEAEATLPNPNAARRAEVKTLRASLLLTAGRTAEGLFLARQAQRDYVDSGFVRANPRLANLLVLVQALRLSGDLAGARLHLAEAEVLFAGDGSHPAFADDIKHERSLTQP